MDPMTASGIGVIPNNNTAVNSALISAMANTLFAEHMQLIGEFKKAFPNGEMDFDIYSIEMKKWKSQNYAAKILRAESIEIKYLEKKITDHFEYVNIQSYEGFINAMYLWLKDTLNVKRVFIRVEEYLGHKHQLSFIVDTNFKKYSVSMSWQIS